MIFFTFVRKKRCVYREAVVIIIERAFATHLPALTALDFNQILGITNYIRYHIDVIFQRDDHGATISCRDGH